MLLNIPDFQSYYRTKVQRKKYRQAQFNYYIHTFRCTFIYVFGMEIEKYVSSMNASLNALDFVDEER